MDARRTVTRARRAFTLVEMLAVIVIIGILAGLIAAAAVRAITRARIATMVLEIGQLDNALSSYKEKLGEYPPDFTDKAAVVRHLNRAFPRYRPSGGRTMWEQFKYDVEAATGEWIQIDQGGADSPLLMDQASALVFWLGGIAPQTGVPRLMGFSANSRNPFDRSSYVDDNGNLREDGGRIGPFFEFQPDRLRDVTGEGGGYYVYYPPGVEVLEGEPYVYFRPRNGKYVKPAGNDGFVFNSFEPVWRGAPPVLPFVDSNAPGAGEGDNLLWVHPDTYQILCPGPDGIYGVTRDGNPPRYPIGSNYTIETQWDNITNFSQGTVGDKAE